MISDTQLTGDSGVMLSGYEEIRSQALRAECEFVDTERRRRDVPSMCCKFGKNTAVWTRDSRLRQHIRVE